MTAQFGSPEWKLTRDEHMAKAKACLEFGGAGDCHDALANMFDGFDAIEDVSGALNAVLHHRTR